MSWTDYAKGIRLCFPRRIPISSVSLPQSLLEPFCLWRLAVQCLSVWCGQKEMRVCMFVCVFPFNLNKTFSLISFHVCKPASPPCSCTRPTCTPDCLGSWKLVSAQEYSDPGGVTPTQHFPPTSSWQQWQDSWETLPLTCMSRCTSGVSVVWCHNLETLLLTTWDLRGCCPHPKKHQVSRGVDNVRARWASVPNGCELHQTLARYLFPGGSVLRAPSTKRRWRRSRHPDLAKEDVSWQKLSSGSAHVFWFSVSVVMDKVPSHDHTSSSMQVFPRRVSCWNFWLLQRESLLCSSSPRTESFLYMGLQIKIAAFHSTLQFSLAAICQIFGLLSLVLLKIKLSTVKQILIQAALWWAAKEMKLWKENLELKEHSSTR